MPKVKPYSDEYNEIVNQQAARIGLTGDDAAVYAETEKRLSEIEALGEHMPGHWPSVRDEYEKLCHLHNQLMSHAEFQGVA